MVCYSTVRELSELLSGQSQTHPLDVAALQLARIEFPKLDIPEYLSLLDGMAAALNQRVNGSGGGSEFIEAANEYIFGELGFQGNEEDYYNPHNSCLNVVLRERTGIPITLSVVYMEIARRLGKRIRGVGLPGHFIVQFEEDGYSAFLDVYAGGAVLSPEQCAELAKETAGFDIAADLRLLQPVDKKYILVRMLNNLRTIYFERRSPGKALQVLDLLIQAGPAAPEEYRQRAVLHVQTQQFHRARADYEKYLELSPDALDRAETIEQLNAVINWIARMN